MKRLLRQTDRIVVTINNRGGFDGRYDMPKKKKCLCIKVKSDVYAMAVKADNVGDIPIEHDLEERSILGVELHSYNITVSGCCWRTVGGVLKCRSSFCA